MPSTPSNPPGLLHPLDLLYRQAGRPLPLHGRVTEAEIPEPFRRLLVHHRDMTSTLEQHHGDGIHLRVLSLAHDGDVLRREVVLCRDQDGEPVEFGATLARLDQFPEPWRSEIVASRRPLGGILNASGKAYTSRPSAFLRIRPDDFLRASLRFEGDPDLYGRQNTLRTPDGQEIASILEILPPARVRAGSAHAMGGARMKP